jgi:hypothetical protein
MKATICDKCGKQMADVANESTTEAKGPDVLVAVRGDVVLQYEDVCDDCEARVRANSMKYLAVKTRVRKGDED